MWTRIIERCWWKGEWANEEAKLARKWWGGFLGQLVCLINQGIGSSLILIVQYASIDENVNNIVTHRLAETSADRIFHWAVTVKRTVSLAILDAAIVTYEKNEEGRGKGEGGRKRGKKRRMRREGVRRRMRREGGRKRGEEEKRGKREGGGGEWWNETVHAEYARTEKCSVMYYATSRHVASRRVASHRVAWRVKDRTEWDEAVHYSVVQCSTDEESGGGNGS